MILEECGHVYVVDAENDRVVRWEKGAKQGTVVVGENGRGAATIQVSRPDGSFFDRDGHLYVSAMLYSNYRVTLGCCYEGGFKKTSIREISKE